MPDVACMDDIVDPVDVEGALVSSSEGLGLRIAVSSEVGICVG